MSSTPETTKISKLAVDDFPQSKQQPLWHVIVLNIMTMSGYTLIWFWKTWKDLADFANSVAESEIANPDTLANPNKPANPNMPSNPNTPSNPNKPANPNTPSNPNTQPHPNTAPNSALMKFRGVSPILMTMGALVPGAQLILTSLLFARLAAIYPDKTSIVSRKPIGTGIAMTLIMFGFFWLYKLPGPFMFLFLLYIIPFVIAQSWVNAFWKTQEQPEMMVRQAFSAGELASLILGAVLLGLIVTGFAIGH